jgi:hypothetical protein
MRVHFDVELPRELLVGHRGALLPVGEEVSPDADDDGVMDDDRSRRTAFGRDLPGGDKEPAITSYGLRVMLFRHVEILHAQGARCQGCLDGYITSSGFSVMRCLPHLGQVRSTPLAAISGDAPVHVQMGFGHVCRCSDIRLRLKTTTGGLASRVMLAHFLLVVGGQNVQRRRLLADVAPKMLGRRTSACPHDRRSMNPPSRLGEGTISTMSRSGACALRL